MTACLLDTGPLVALLDQSEPDHHLVRDFLARFKGPRLLTTGAVITEAVYFLSEIENGTASLVAFLDASGADICDVFHPDALAAAVGLMSKYADAPMDFADATLVWTAAQTGTDKVLTLDRRGFSTYRFAKNRRFKLVLDEN